MQISSKILSTDVLVVGAGFAGCMAALRAKETGETGSYYQDIG